MSRVRYVVQWDEQPIHLTKVLCTLLESQTLVDLTVNCNSYTIKVHKCVLAANSTYFRDHLQKDMSIDRVVINSIKHTILKSLIEYMYCGETTILEENIWELIAAAKFFSIRGLSSVMPQKLDGDHGNKGSEFNLMNKPPLFFSKNDNKYVFKDKDYSLYDLGRRKHSHSKVTDEAHVALAKEEAASRLALEMLKKDINNTSNVFVIDETCTEATVETNLTAQYDNSNNMMHIQEYVLQNEIKSDTSELANEQNNIDIDSLVPKTKQSPNDEMINEMTNVSILYKPNKTTYVNVNVGNKILENLQNTHAITYHVMPEATNVDLQQYICNNFGQYSVQIEASQPESSYEIMKNAQSGTNKPLTFTQLVADTVSSDYDSSYTENSVPYAAMRKTEDNFQYGSAETDSPKLVDEEIFTSSCNENFVADNAHDMRSTNFLSANIISKKKRGRPAKKKIVGRNIENENKFSPDQISTKSDHCHPISSNMIEQSGHRGLNIKDNKKNDNPYSSDLTLKEINSQNNISLITSNEASGNDNICSYSKENRRQTRSSFKFH